MNTLTRDQNVPTDATVAPQNDFADQRQAYYITPLADVESTENAYIIRAEMPGVDKSNLEITVDKGELTIVGRHHIEPPAGEPVYLEIRQADFRRVYELDPAVDTTKITAHIDQGVLTLTLPKAEAVKPRKITVD
jgi:HSP20 family protein